MAIRLSEEVVDFIRKEYSQEKDRHGCRQRVIEKVKREFGITISPNTINRRAKGTQPLFLDENESVESRIKKYASETPQKYGWLTEVRNKLLDECGIKVSINKIKRTVKDDYSPSNEKLKPEIVEYIKLRYVELRNSKKIAEKIADEIGSKFNKVVHLRTVQSYISKYFPDGYRTHRLWTEKEDAILNEYAGFIPFIKLVERIHTRNKTDRRALRTERAIRTRCYDLGLSISVTGEWLSKTDIRQGLGVSDKKFDMWLEDNEIRNILKPHISDKKQINIRIQALKAFLGEYPGLVLTEAKPKPAFLLSLL